MPVEELLDYFSHHTGQRGPTPSHLQLDDEGAWGRFLGLRLSSVFQPLPDASTLTPLAHETLLRVNDAACNPLYPASAFSLPKSSDEAVYFDRLWRLTPDIVKLNRSLTLHQTDTIAPSAKESLHA